MVAGEEVFEALTAEDAPTSVWNHQMESEEYALSKNDESIEVASYQSELEDSWVYDELKQVHVISLIFFISSYSNLNKNKKKMIRYATFMVDSSTDKQRDSFNLD